MIICWYYLAQASSEYDSYLAVHHGCALESRVWMPPIEHHSIRAEDPSVLANRSARNPSLGRTFQRVAALRRAKLANSGGDSPSRWYFRIKVFNRKLQRFSVLTFPMAEASVNVYEFYSRPGNANRKRGIRFTAPLESIATMPAYRTVTMRNARCTRPVAQRVSIGHLAQCEWILGRDDLLAAHTSCAFDRATTQSLSALWSDILIWYSRLVHGGCTMP